MPKFIFFDLGNVLLRFSADLMLERGAKVLGCSVAELNELIYGNGWCNKLETGKITEAEFFEVICDRFKVRPNVVEFTDAINDIFAEIVEIRPFIEYLSSINFPRGILSNTSYGHWNHIISKYSYLPKLIPENHVLSFNAGAAKPDRKIFEYAMKTAQKTLKNSIKLNATDILFIDDLKQNIDSASIFGFDTIQFTNWQHVTNELKKRNFELFTI
jgi:putative hydrolase of the HAD superfamily